MSAIAKVNEDLEMIKYYDSVKDAAIANNLSVRQVYNLIRDFPKANKNRRFQWYDDIRSEEVWIKHPWLNIYVSSLGRVDANGKKPTYGTKRNSEKARIKIDEEWYIIEELVDQAFPVIKYL